MQAQTHSQGGDYQDFNQSGGSRLGLVEINNKLSSGCYSCYDCWLYVIVLEGIIGLFRSAGAVSSDPFFIIMAIGAAIEIAYGLIMMDVMKNRESKKAALGLKLAIACSALLVGSLSVVGYLDVQESGTRLIPVVVGFVVVYGLYAGLVLVLPAYKIKGLLERREAIIQSANPYNV